MNPYKNLEPRAFWKTAVGGIDAMDIADLATCKNRIAPTAKVATAGSCFAQHVSRAIRDNGFAFLDVEPAPDWLKEHRRRDFGFGMFSARYGNIYTSAQLKQLFLRAYLKFEPEEPLWEKDGRFFDPFRPSIEPNGFSSAGEALRSQQAHLHSVRQMVKLMDVFVYTLGLTEHWRAKADGAVYPICPGVQAGEFDPKKHEFANLTFGETLADMKFVLALLFKRRPDLKVILTVSPVPLTATASGEHILTATTYSKSVLRAVAGQLASEYPSVDYFPSYEIITAPAFEGRFYEANKREVRPEGVAFVMKNFMRQFCEPQDATHVPARPQTREEALATDEDAVLCDEQALEEFAP